MTHFEPEPKAGTLFPSEASLAAEARAEREREQLKRNKQEVPTQRHQEKEPERRQFAVGVIRLAVALILVPVVMSYFVKAFSMTSYLAGLGVAGYLVATHYTNPARPR